MKRRIAEGLTPPHLRPRCRQCFETLRELTQTKEGCSGFRKDGGGYESPPTVGSGRFGYAGCGLFCTSHCAFAYAVRHARGNPQQRH